MSGARVLLVGLDGADWSILQPSMDAGELPHLAALAAGGLQGVLVSTTPAVTYPAWLSFLTGVNPGRHGVLDFARWQPGTYEVRFESAAPRVPTVFERLSAAGRRVAAVGFPGTYPPPHLDNGFALSGFDAPVALAPGPDFARPASLHARLEAEHGRWTYADIDETRVRPGWHRRALRTLLAGLAVKGDYARGLLADRPWELFAVHLGETDTVGHHFLPFHEPDSPRRPADVHPEEAGAVRAVYRLADRILGDLQAAAGPEARVLVVSDHGMESASDHVFHPDRALASGGFLAFEKTPPMTERVGARAREAALRHLPGRLKERLFRSLGSLPSRLESRRRLGGTALARSAAFSECLTYAPSVRLNIRGREPAGVIAPEDAEVIARAVTAHLLSLTDPETGEALVRGVLPREAVLHGPALSDAPDLYLQVGRRDGRPYSVLAGRRPGPVVSRLEGDARLGGKGRGPAGVHRPDGIVLLAGPDIGPGDLGRVPIACGAPTLMALAGLEPDESMEAAPLLVPGRAARPGATPPPPRVSPYSPEQAARVAARLAGLGYLDG